MTLMQRSPRILKSYDPEISEAIAEALTEQGMTFLTGARFERVGRPSEVNHLVDLGYPTDNYVEPRFGFAYAPVWNQGLLGKLTGGLKIPGLGL